MIKKFISVLCCFTPVYGAMADIAYTMKPTQENGNIVFDDAGGLTLQHDLTLQKGTDIEGGDIPVTGLSVTGGGITIANFNLASEGEGNQSGTGSQNLYVPIYNMASDKAFTLEANGAINMDTLVMADGARLVIKGTTAPVDLTINNGFGQANNLSNASLSAASGINNFTANGAINTAGNLNIQATGDVSAKVVNLGFGVGEAPDVIPMATIKGKNVTLEQIKANRWTGDTLVEATGGNITVTGTDQFGVQTQGGNMSLTASGNITTNGNVENAYINKLTLNATDINVGGTMKNDDNISADQAVRGKLDITATNLTVSGQDATLGASLVNGGIFTATIGNNTTLVHGFDVSRMTSNDSFSLTTNTIDLGDQKSLVLNHGTLILDVTGSTATLNSFSDDTGIINGTDTDNTTSMTLLANSITASNVENYAELYIGSGDIQETQVNSLHLTGYLKGNAKSVTDIIANNELKIDGDITHNGTSMDLYSADVTLGGNVFNNAGTLNIINTNAASTLTTAENKKIENKANLNFTADNITIGGQFTNISGESKVYLLKDKGTSVLQMADVDVDGGKMEIDSKGRGILLNNGSLNVGANDGVLNVFGTSRVGDRNFADLTVNNNIDITGSLVTSDSRGENAGYMYLVGENLVFNIVGTTQDNTTGIKIGKNVDVNTNKFVSLNTPNIAVGGNIRVNDNSTLVLGALLDGSNNTGKELTVGTSLTDNVFGIAATGSSIINIFNTDITTGYLSEQGTSQIIVHGPNGTLVANGYNPNITPGAKTAIDLAGGLWMLNNNALTHNGLIIDSDNYEIKTTYVNGANFNIATGMQVDSGKTLALGSSAAFNMNGAVDSAATLLKITALANATFTDDITNSGVMNISALNLFADDVTNTGTWTFATNNRGNATIGDVDNTGTFNARATSVTLGDVINHGSNSAVFDITGTSQITMASLKDVDYSVANLRSVRIQIDGNTYVAGNIVQGATDSTSGNLNLYNSGSVLIGENLTDTGDFIANDKNVRYIVKGKTQIGRDLTVSNPAKFDMTTYDSVVIGGNITNNNMLSLQTTATITAKDVTNNAGNLTLSADTSIDVNDVIGNAGLLTLKNKESYDSFTYVHNYTILGGNAELYGTNFESVVGFDAGGTLYQNYTNAMTQNHQDVNVVSNLYNIKTPQMIVGEIEQLSGEMNITTSDLMVKNGGITATDLQIEAFDNNWLTVEVHGDVSENVDFIRLKKGTITGDYTFGNGSKLWAMILPTGAIDDRNYWSSVRIGDDNESIVLTDAPDGEALITVGGKFVSTLSPATIVEDYSKGVELKDGQVGITLYSAVDQGTAIWLVHTDKGVEELYTKIRNLKVNFCNADNSICFDYLEAADPYNKLGEDAPAYISAREHNGLVDSLYIVFDPRFGGPVEVFPIRPIVDEVPDYTPGEDTSAEAIDELIHDALEDAKFYERTPIEAIPLVFEGTNLEEMANELYERMELYAQEHNKRPLARFSRLFQPRELEQMLGDMTLNEHANFRSFEDHMVDEFIWNRNRRLNKAWMDFEYGFVSQNGSDDLDITGSRFNVSAGFDWQQTRRMILGLTARVSYTTTDNSDSMDLSYADKVIDGNVDINVTDTDVGVGAYMMYTLNNKLRLFGNLFLDMHMFEVSRDQNYVDHITGDGYSYAVTSEWGLLHDWLNQYIVGNLYTRIGYNTGFDVTERAGGEDYMNFKSDGYMILTPGYSLTAQKRIYPSAWFQIRPYATIGAEYDVLGAPDNAKYKFARAHSYTTYDIDINPFWANIGGGVEFLSAMGAQVGLDYRYQYNSLIQIHNIKVSGLYRF